MISKQLTWKSIEVLSSSEFLSEAHGNNFSGYSITTAKIAWRSGYGDTGFVYYQNAPSRYGDWLSM